MSKVTQEEREAIKKRFFELTEKGGNTKTQIISIIAEEFDRGRTTIFDNLILNEIEEIKELLPASSIPSVIKMPNMEYVKVASKKKTFIITGFEIRIGVNEPFLQCLDTLAKELDAEQMLVPIWYKDVDFIPKRLKDQFQIVTNNLEFNENLIFHYSPTNALVASALSGWAGAFTGKSCILPGLNKELTTESSHISCKQLMTTGSVGYMDADFSQYGEHLSIDEKSLQSTNVEFIKRWSSATNRSQGKTTAIAQKFIVPCALIVDIIDNKTFLTRYVSMHQEGVLYDLNKKITPGKVESSTPDGLVIGDYHVYTMNEENHQSNIEMIKFFNPKETVLNDAFNGSSCCYHEISNTISQVNAPSIEEEAEVTKEVLLELSKLTKLTYVHSNHDDFLSKSLNYGENTWKINGNLAISYELQAYRIRTGKHPIIKLLNLEDIPNLTFSPDKITHYVNGIATPHGHELYGGGGLKAFARIYNHVVIGHEHKPQVFRNAVCVGATAERDQSYSKDVTPTMPANCLIQPDGSLQLLPIIGKTWIK